MDRKRNSSTIGKIVVYVVFICYCLFFLWVTVFSRQPSDHRTFVPQLFWSYRAWIAGESYGKREVIQNIQNILAFIPFGFLFPIKKAKYTLFGAALFSTIIELVQYICMLGWCEVDDVICNTLGAVIGFWLWFSIYKLLLRP